MSEPDILQDPQQDMPTEVEQATPKTPTIVMVPLGSMIQIGEMPFKVDKVQKGKLTLRPVGFTLVSGRPANMNADGVTDANGENNEQV